MSNIFAGMFLATTSSVVGTLAFLDPSPGMGWVMLGCLACFVGGWATVAMELSNG
jgi:hypothetical protein